MIGEALYTCASFCCVHRVYGQQAWVSLHGVGGYLSLWEHALHAWDQGIHSEKNG